MSEASPSSAPVRAISARLYKAISVVTVVGLLAFGAVKAVNELPAPIVDAMLETDVRDQAQLWERRVRQQMENAELSFRSASVTERDRQYLSSIPHASDVYRFKLFTADGVVYWSTRTSDIGGENTKPYFVDVVAKGDVFYKGAVKPAAEIDGLELHSMATDAEGEHHIAEIYQPIVIDGEFIGAIEFYTDLTDVRAKFIARVETGLLAISGTALAIMLIAIAATVFRSQSRVRRLRQQATKEREMLERQMRLAREVRLLGELNEWLQSSSSLEELFEMVSKFLSHILPTSAGSIYVYSNSRDVLDGAVAWNGAELKEHIRPDGCWGLRRGRTYAYGRSEVDFTCDHVEPHDDLPYFCFPILAHGETVGLMHLKARTAADAEALQESQKLAQMCAEQISMAIANVRMRDQLQEQSIRDPLTGLLNRRYLTDTLRKMVERANRTHMPISLVSVDVDHFKKFNDNHGHDAGDMVLRAVGTVLQQACDGDEIACRMGGEEFMMVLPGAAPAEAMARAERVRYLVEQIAVRYGDKTLPRITISLGIAHYPEHGTTPQDLIRTADDALYQAKAQGRNTVVVGGHGGADNDDYNDAATGDDGDSSDTFLPVPVAAE